MDRLIYTAMTGANHVLQQQATVANNLANVSSTGFKAQVDNFRAVPIQGEGAKTRAFVVDAEVGTDFSAGALQQTGKPLDIALNGEGFFAVQRPDGSEAYTRNGALRVDETGRLQTSSGLTVMGDAGPIIIPQDVTISIGTDGTVSSVNNMTMPGPSNIIGRIKLINPDIKTMKRSEDGLFVAQDGNPIQPDASVKLASGYIESSNVNVVDSMVKMISLGRQFDMQMRMMQSAKENDDKATQIISNN